MSDEYYVCSSDHKHLSIEHLVWCEKRNVELLKLNLKESRANTY